MKVSKVLLIHSGHHDSAGKPVKATGWLDRITTGNIAELGLPLIAAYTPSHITVEHADDYFEEIPWDSDADVVAISAYVMMASRAVDIAKEFKKRGKIVVMGGYLPTMHPELVLDHVDAICQGDGDEAWPKMLVDIEAGTLQKIYKLPQPQNLAAMPVPRYDLIKKGRFVSYPVQATRGCPFKCGYCSITQFNELTYRLRPVEEIVRDIKAHGARMFHFVDDNLMENRKYSKELFAAMKPLKRLWGTQTTINIAKDPELLDAAYGAGCRFAAVGIESLSQGNLNAMSKSFNKVEDLARNIKIVQDAGIGVHALIVFGFPEDTPETFDQTVDFLEEHGVAIAEFFIYTPYPKTPEGKRIYDAGLVVDTDLNHHRETYVVFKHPKMSTQEIVEGYWHAMRRFYSFRSIFKRIWRGTFRDKLYHFGFNLAYWVKIQRGIVPVYFGRGNDVPPRSRTKAYGNEQGLRWGRIQAR